jgi:ATP phosphoribosyltransferase regulatory subunit
MPAFPTYGPELIEALDAQGDAILGVFASRGYLRHESSVLQPADIFLDRSGEEIRRRTFELTDPSGRELCLRPDLTIPTCKWQVESGNAYPARLCYNGLAFRHQPLEPHRPTQFYQAGAELFGLEDRAAAEVEIMRLAVDAVRAAGLKRFEMKVGDLTLLSALIDALNVPVQWRGRLKRHFWRKGYFEALLQRLATGASSDTQRLLAHLGGLEPNEARVAVEGLLDMVSEAPLGARTREEIVDRLIEQAADAAAIRLDPRIAKTITSMLAISGSAPEAMAEIRTLMKCAGVTLEPPLVAMEGRLAALQSLGIDPENIAFEARFGRNMEYYTGFVFELWSRDAEGPVQVAGGGRYDGLLEALGAGRSIPAIGCAIRTERVLAARRAQGGAA